MGVLVLVLVLVLVASAFDYIMSVTQGREFYEASGMTDYQIRYFLNLPLWAVVAWTVSVWAGLFTALFAMARHPAATILFMLTVAGNIAYGAYVYLLSDGVKTMGAIWFMPIVIALIHLAIVFYSKKLVNSK